MPRLWYRGLHRLRSNCELGKRRDCEACPMTTVNLRHAKPLGASVSHLHFVTKS